MIHKRQKMLAHVYADAAELDQMDYRTLLRTATGLASCADPEMTQSGYENFMAMLEARLFDRVDRGLVEDPRGRNRYIKDAHYWRGRLPRAGRINSRQVKLIRDIWAQLQRYLPSDKAGTDYFAGIVRKATGLRSLGLEALTREQAALVIDALKDRLRYAIKGQPH